LSRSTKKTVDLDELASRLKQFRQDPSSVPADQLKAELDSCNADKELKSLAKVLGLRGYSGLRKPDLINLLMARKV
ncbi:MAG: Rho termination factor N-terminal domain-containing protein, partial [Cyanobacteriota bacterium]